MRRGLLRLAINLVVVAALLFIPAGSLRYWPGWLYLLLIVGFWTFFFIVLLRHDPQLLARRMQRKEAERAQRIFQRIFPVIFVAAFVTAGLDYRFGWSREMLGPVPFIVVLLAQALVAASYWLVFWVMKTNRFAASTIQVEAEQTVIDNGPYAFVRHPMYLGMTLMMLATPLALASYVALPVFALQVPILVYRLVHEEKTLCRDLPGYAEYCERIRRRLVPGVW